MNFHKQIISNLSTTLKNNFENTNQSNLISTYESQYNSCMIIKIIYLITRIII
jgi:hypothetical protein